MSNNQNSDTADRSTKRAALDEAAVECETPAAQRSGSHRSGGSASGAPPSNTAPDNCNGEGDTRILHCGVDSLYLSYRGKIKFEVSQQLIELKALAQSPLPLQQAEAIYLLGEHQFEVMDRGSRRFPYILANNAYRIELSSFAATSLPLAHIQIGSHWLLSKGVLPSLTELRYLMGQCGDDIQEARASRADLAVDFMCSLPFGDIPVRNWVSRTRRVSSHTMERKFTGFSFGLGGDLSARLYDKTQEIVESGKEYMRSIWHQKGWEPGQTVWRLEFQFRRPALKVHGVDTVYDLLDKLGQLWRYATQSWLKLTTPNDSDDTQSRWPIHPIWREFGEVIWEGSEEGLSVPIRADRRPTDRYLFVNGLAGLTSFMAREGITDPEEAFKRYYHAARNHHESFEFTTGVLFKDYLLEKAATKARLYNVVYPGVGDLGKNLVIEARAEEYRKASDGE